MVKELSQNEYEELAGIYPVTSFMGGFGGSDESATIYLYGDKITLVSPDEIEKLAEIMAIQQTEGEELVAAYESRGRLL